MASTSPRSDMPRTAALDAARADAWNVLRLLAEWDGDGVPGHEEGRRIVTAARSNAEPLTTPLLDDALDVIDPTGQSFPVALAAAWDARKANA